MSIMLSLVCPVYKVAEYIPDLMHSLMAGVNNEQVEIIFVNDCCPENSIEICEQFLAEYQHEIKFKSVVLNLGVNQGLSGARNEGLKVAQGEYIGFIDSDDVIASSYWNTLAPYIEKSCSDIIEFTFKEFATSLPNEDKQIVVNELPSSSLNPFYTGFFVWIRLYKKQVVNDLLFPEDKIYEDIFYNIHAFAKADSNIRLDACLVYYRKRQTSLTTTRTASYSNLLLNMVNSVASTIQSFKDKDIVAFQLARYSLLVSLKGFTIKERAERKLFFKQCKSINASLSPLFKEYNRSLSGAFRFKMSQAICVLGKYS